LNQPKQAVFPQLSALRIKTLIALLVPKRLFKKSENIPVNSSLMLPFCLERQLVRKALTQYVKTAEKVKEVNLPSPSGN